MPQILKKFYARLYNFIILYQARNVKGWRLFKSRRLDLNLLLNLDNLIDFLIWKKGAFEEEVLQAIDHFQVHDPFLFIDVGSQLGQFSLYVCKKHPHAKILSFEPYRPAIHQQQANMLLNNLRYKLVELALSDSNGEAFLYAPSHGLLYGKKNPGMASLFQDHTHSTEEAEVVVCTLDSFEESWKKVEQVLVKLDVEGAELKVLKGAERLLHSKKRISLIIELLFKSKPEFTKRVLEFLLQSGFSPCDGSWKKRSSPEWENDGNYFFIK